MSTATDRVIRAMADKNDGRITPEEVVAAAEDPSSPLHAEFLWDDTAAAKQHRLNQARALIRSVQVVISTTTYDLRAPAFVRDPTLGRKQGYASLARLRSDEDIAREAVVAEFSRAAAALSRAKSIAQALGMTEVVEELHARIIQVQSAFTVPEADAGSA